MPHPLLVAPMLLALSAPLFGQQKPVPPIPPLRELVKHYVDFHRDLARTDVVVVVGTVGRHKEGKRVRLPAGSVGPEHTGPEATGAHHFKIPVQAPVLPRVTFAGKADKISISFHLHVASLPDGTQSKKSSIDGPSFAERDLALFVLAPRDKGSGFEILRAIPFHQFLETGPDAEAVFLDRMFDFYTVNRRVLDYENALGAVDAAKDDASRKKALESLQRLVEQPPLQLRQRENDGLLEKHVTPLHTRAKQKLADAAPKPAAEPGDAKE